MDDFMEAGTPLVDCDSYTLNFIREALASSVQSLNPDDELRKKQEDALESIENEFKMRGNVYYLHRKGHPGY